MVSAQELESALMSHAKWKRRLNEAIRTQASEFQPRIVGSDGACEFGQWLDSLPEDGRRSRHYEEVKKLHAEFHRTAAEILRLALAGKQAEAEKELGMEGSYVKASGALIFALKRWQDSL